MSERKVLNKYFPPDFDPSKIPRRKIARDAQQVVRLMAPCTMCCLTCGEFIYKGKKFNAKKETALGEEYYGIKIFRFYIKCTRCSAEITFKTDPKNADYIIEHGATRNYEPWQEAIPNASADDDEAKEDDAEDPMAMLEASQATSKRQMEDEDALADLRMRNARMARSDVDAEAILAQQHAKSEEEAEKARLEQEEEDEIVNQYFYKVAKPGGVATSLPANGASAKGKGKEKETKSAVNGIGLGGYGSDDASDSGEDGDESPEEQATVTVKRGIIPTTKPDAQPTVQDLLAARGIVINSNSAPPPAAVAKKSGFNLSAGGMKRKDLASSLGIKIAKKKKV